MSRRTVEITILSAENLTIHRKSVKKNAFVVAKVDQDPNNFKSTNSDVEGGSNPSWNQTVTIDMPHHAKYLIIEVKTRIGSMDKVIGTAAIPITDLVGDYMPASYLHFLSYRLKDERGQRNGIVNVSARLLNGPEFSGPVVRKNAMVEYGCSSSSSSSSNFQKSTMGLPMGGAYNYGYGAGVAMGIPVRG